MGPLDSHRAAPRQSHDKSAPLDLSHHFSVVTKRRLPSRIKQAYKLFQIPGILNIAGGLPNVAFFPFDTLEAQTAKPERWTPSPNHPSQSAASTSSADPAAATHIAVPKTVDETDPLKKIDLATALQYGMASGYPPLLSWIRQFTREHLHPDTPYRDGPDVVLTCGSTDGFAKALNLFVDQWTEGINDPSERPGLLVEKHVYPNVLSQAQPYGVQPVTVKADAAGMAVKGPGGLEDVLANWDPSKGKRPHLMYTVTLGHNPTGIVLSVERKKEIYAVCSKYDVIIVEDEPYWYLQFPSAAEEEAKSRGLPRPAPSAPRKPARSSGFPFLDSLTPSFLSVDTDGRVVRLDTFSKTIAPGCRLGWITAQPAFIERFERLTEATTAQPSGFVQGLVSELVLGPHHQAPHTTTTTTNNNNTPPSRSAFSLFRSPQAAAASSPKGWDMSGWVRWLSGLRGSYEARMARMCRTLDAGACLVTTTTSTSPFASEWSPVRVDTTTLYTFAWPRGGMFVWLRAHLEAHPLWGATLSDGTTTLGGPSLATALLIFLTTKPYRVVIAGGATFSATDAIREREGWAYIRLCFAAESEENVDRASERFVRGMHAFWEVRDVKVVEKLLGEFGVAGVGGDGEAGEEVCRLDWFMGC